MPRVLRQFGSAVIQFLRETIIHIDNVFYSCSVLTLAFASFSKGNTTFGNDKLRALNFVIHSALGGGVNSSLRLDRHGKTLSSHLLHELIIPISKDLLPINSPYLKKFKD